jgi:hypothetical protein
MAAAKWNRHPRCVHGALVYWLAEDDPSPALDHFAMKTRECKPQRPGNVNTYWRYGVLRTVLRSCGQRLCVTSPEYSTPEVLELQDVFLIFTIIILKNGLLFTNDITSGSLQSTGTYSAYCTICPQHRVGIIIDVISREPAGVHRPLYLQRSSSSTDVTDRDGILERLIEILDDHF